MKSKAFVLILGLMLALPAAAATREERRVADAADVLDQLLRIPEKSIPPALLSRAYAVAVIPNVVKIGFGIGARRGRGILVVRQDDDSWSNPAFITMTGGSIGWQIGAQSTDVILVFQNTKRRVENISSGKLTLGADASDRGRARRPPYVRCDRHQVSRQKWFHTRAVEVCLPVSLSKVPASRWTVRRIRCFYGSTSMSPEQHLSISSPNVAPNIANEFVQILTAQTARLPTQARHEHRHGSTIRNPRSAEDDTLRMFGPSACPILATKNTIRTIDKRSTSRWIR